MSAILSHELKTSFRSLTPYIFGAFLLVFTGVGAMMYNINSAVSNFEYVLEFCAIVLVVLIPIMTMRSLSEERKQKTDQLLYSLPLTTTQIVLGKYLALLIIFAIPLVIIAFYPLIFSQFGDVFLPTSYGSLVAFIFMGAALIAVGEFISSLTDNQGFAAGISIIVMLFNYFSVALSEYVSTSVTTTVIACWVLILVLALIIKFLTKNTYVAYGVGLALAIALLAVLFFASDKLEGVLPNIMTNLSLFKRFSDIVSGSFDLTTILYYISVAVFFLFLTVQSLEKRRYN